MIIREESLPEKNNGHLKTIDNWKTATLGAYYPRKQKANKRGIMKVLPFWGGPFSNWFIAPFRALTMDERLIEFNCVEQFMMVQKAMCFNDRATARKILDTPDPKEQKTLGRQVKNFDETEWMCGCRSFVKPGLVAKFTQNPELNKELIETRGRLLVEASPSDHVWGVGLPANCPTIEDTKTWKGFNFLGFLLTDLRVEMIGE